MAIGQEMVGHNQGSDPAEDRVQDVSERRKRGLSRVYETISLARARMIVKSIGLATMMASPFWALALFYSGDYEHSSALALIPIVVALNLVIAFRLTRHDPFLHELLPIAILLKVAACGLYVYMVFNILGGGDVGGYFENGRQIAS